MNCREYRHGLIEWGRGQAPGETVRQVLMDHLEECAECVRFLEAQQTLTAAIRDLTADEIPPIHEFAAPVMAAFDRAHPPRRPARMRAMGWVLAAAMAAAACLTVISTRRPAPVARPTVAIPAALVVSAPRAHPPVAAKQTTHVRLSKPQRTASEEERPFYPIPYTAPLGPGEWARVERMQIPITALIAAGFHMPAIDPAAMVEADVLVSQDGRIRAIRPLSISNSN
jgi:hypothetical protein